MQLNSLHIFLAMAIAQQLPQVKVLPFGVYNGQAASVPAIVLVHQRQQHNCCMHHACLMFTIYRAGFLSQTLPVCGVKCSYSQKSV